MILACSPPGLGRVGCGELPDRADHSGPAMQDVQPIVGYRIADGRVPGQWKHQAVFNRYWEAQALAFLADRTGQADTAGAQILAAELGWLPLALAQAAAVIASQHLSYGTYLDRLHPLPIADLLAPVEAGQYPQGVAETVLLSLDALRAGDDSGACGAVMALLAVLSAAGVPRSLVHVAGREGLPSRGQPLAGLVPDVVDRALARLAGVSLLTFSLDGSVVAAHQLVMRVIRENLAASNFLLAVCEAVAQLLTGMAVSMRHTWHEDPAAARDLVEQIMALYESSAACPADSTLDRRMARLRLEAVFFLNELGEAYRDPARPDEGKAPSA